jgi:citrate lyase beta subunit
MVVLRIRRVLVERDGVPEPQDLPSVNAGSSTFASDIAAMVESSAEALILRGLRTADHVQKCDICISVAEARAGRREGLIAIVACVDSAAGLLAVSTLAGKSARLSAIAFDRAAVCADIGCNPDSALAEHAWMQFAVTARTLALPAYEIAG